jgi:integration host factor subunit alpha
MNEILDDKHSQQTITRSGLAEALFQEVGLPRKECESLLGDVLNEISDCLAEGEPVKISHFASLSIRQKNERIGRNPKTGEETPILPRKVIVFKATKKLKKQVNSRNE